MCRGCNAVLGLRPVFVQPLLHENLRGIAFPYQRGGAELLYHGLAKFVLRPRNSADIVDVVDCVTILESVLGDFYAIEKPPGYLKIYQRIDNKVNLQEGKIKGLLKNSEQFMTAILNADFSGSCIYH